MIEYNDLKHAYFFDGEKIPSVTQITEVLSSYYYRKNNNSEWLLEQAMEKGTMVHAITEELDKKGEVSVDSDLKGYAIAYRNFLTDHEPVWEGIEEIVFDENRKYAGRLDRRGLLDDKYSIVDIKTTKTINKQVKVIYAVQLALYSLALDKAGDIKLYILQLLNSGEYKLIEIDPDYGLALEVFEIYKLLNPKPRSKKLIKK